MRAGLEHIALAAQTGFQRHHDVLAQAVERWIGDLGELLAEAVIERAHPRRQDRHGRIVAHRADRLGLGFGQHLDDLAPLLARQVEHLLVGRKGVGVEGVGGHVDIDQFGVQVLDAGLEPVPPGVQGLELIVDLAAVQQLALLQIGDQDLPGSKASARLDLGRVDIDHAGFRSHDQSVVLAQRPAGRPQAVAIESTNRMLAVAHDQASRTVPAFLVKAVVLVEGAQVGIEVVGGLPGRGNQDTHGLGQGHTAGHQQLQHVVQRARVGAVHGHRGIELGQLGQ